MAKSNEVIKAQLVPSQLGTLASAVRAELAACQAYNKAGNKLEAYAAAERLNKAVNEYIFKLTK